MKKLLMFVLLISVFPITTLITLELLNDVDPIILRIFTSILVGFAFAISSGILVIEISKNTG